MAKAIVAVVRDLGKVHAGVHRNVPYVRLTGRDFDLTVLGSDWEKILPYIQDGSFSPALDKLFYERVLYILQELFPDDYPTSNL